MRVGESFCPGVLHAVPAKDGMLMRVRTPGGFLSARQLCTLADTAETFADGQIEITSRANLQLRAIRTENLQSVAAALAAAGLLPSPQHDRVRNIVTSPLAGFDPEELFDTRMLVQELDHRLTSNALFIDLHPKFGFGLDGGGPQFSREKDDLTLRATTFEGSIYFQLLVAGVNTGFVVLPEHAVDLMLQAATHCIRVARQLSLPARAKAITALPNGLAGLLDASSHLLIHHPTPEPIKVASATPLGFYKCNEAGYSYIVPSIPLGRITAHQARSIARAAQESDADLRLACWRGIVLAHIPEGRIAAVASQLESSGLSCDARDGFRGIAACAGSVGCDASFADVRGHAMALAQHLSGRESNANWTVNFSGCEKRCAMRHGAAVELVANAEGYCIHSNGELISGNSTFDSALNQILTAHTSMHSGVSP
jgi:precorrin-3B synthase